MSSIYHLRPLMNVCPEWLRGVGRGAQRAQNDSWWKEKGGERRRRRSKRWCFGVGGGVGGRGRSVQGRGKREKVENVGDERDEKRVKVMDNDNRKWRERLREEVRGRIFSEAV